MMTRMAETALHFVAFFATMILAIWLGLSGEAAKSIAGLVLLALAATIAAKSAYRDARRRQRWPSKNQRRSPPPANC